MKRNSILNINDLIFELKIKISKISNFKLLLTQIQNNVKNIKTKQNANVVQYTKKINFLKQI